MTEKNMTKTQVIPWCSLMMCHLDFHVSLRMSAKYRDDIGFLKNGWWKSLWKWGATKLSHAIGMHASLKNQELIQKCGEYDGVIVCVCVCDKVNSLYNSTCRGVSRWDGGIAGSEWKETKHIHAHLMRLDLYIISSPFCWNLECHECRGESGSLGLKNARPGPKY